MMESIRVNTSRVREYFVSIGRGSRGERGVWRGVGIVGMKLIVLLS